MCQDQRPPGPLHQLMCREPAIFIACTTILTIALAILGSIVSYHFLDLYWGHQERMAITQRGQ